MASPAGRIRPGRYLGLFALIAVVLYLLVFFTGSGKPTPKLGIDLQGGTRVTLTARTPDGSAPSKDSLNQARQIIERRVNGIGVSGTEVVLDGNNIVITVPGAQGNEAKKLGQTAKLGFRKVLDAQQTTAPPTPAAPGTDNQSPQQIQEAKAARQAPALVTGSGDSLAESAPAKQALAAFTCSAQDPLRGNDDPNLPLMTCNQDGSEKYVLSPVFLQGTEIDNAVSSPPAQNKPGWTVDLTFKSGGRQTWADFTSKNVNQRAAFVLDTQVVSAPTIQSAIVDGNTQISGNFTQQQTKDLADILKYGSLPLSFTSSDATTVSATLGLASLKAGLIAGGVGLALVFVYSLFYYRLLGALTIVSLGLSGLVVYGVLVLLGRWIGFTLDLPGVAGFIISIGVTADSFVVFFERLKDEVREGRTFRSAVPRGWARARRTILASDAILFLASAVLYAIAVGDVQGFAFTLGLSTVLDLLVVFLVTHPLVSLASRSRSLSRPGLTGLGGVQHLAEERRRARKAAAAAAKEA
ncbi:protein translocase subunit SecD [Amycolatopsis alkalitolerans]|uniref:Protein translocase subunit SecD n=1 Tax=Amycolatopsis alkalitolerans TaxID=2547244 RepID=A0A5C4M2H0_9PSEU|nr:protein translocase subunit SecD [Amycolatopsis alkalitolerans]TNC26428.1 protein translocase subunit SecD [Amycolatopsis alkalitolerans]